MGVFLEIALVKAETEDTPKVVDADLGISREGSRTGTRLFGHFFVKFERQIFIFF